MRHVRSALVLIACALSAPAAFAQSAPQPSELNPTRWGVVYDIPATTRVVVKEDIPFLKRGATSLTIDLYQPPGVNRGEKRPAVIFINAVGDRPGDKVKRWAIYRTWPRLIAAHGMIGISMDADGEAIQESIHGLFRYLAQHGAEHGVDAERLGIYAASANVSGATAYLASDSASKGIRAAALFYGRPPEEELRTDLPTLFIVAAGDAPGMGAPLTALWQRVVEKGAPWTLQFAAGMPHAFDAFTDSDDSRRVLQQSIGFWKSNLEPVPAPPWQPSPARAIVAAQFGRDNERTATLLTAWVADHPRDGEAYMSLGRALAEVGRLPESEIAYTRAYGLDSTNPGVLIGMSQVKLGQRRWEEALGFLSRARQAGIENSYIVGMIGWSQLNLNRNAEAARSYERAIEIGVPPGRSTLGLAWYNLACAYARLGRVDQAFTALGKAVDEGMSERATFEQDDDLRTLRGDPRFTGLLARLQPAAS